MFDKELTRIIQLFGYRGKGIKLGDKVRMSDDIIERVSDSDIDYADMLSRESHEVVHIKFEGGRLKYSLDCGTFYWKGECQKV